MNAKQRLHRAEYLINGFLEVFTCRPAPRFKGIAGMMQELLASGGPYQAKYQKQLQPKGIMTIDQRRAECPGCPDAVAFHEKAVHESMWEFARLKGFTPEQLAHVLKIAAASTDELAGGEFTLHGKMAQMDDPDFLRYVARKLHG